MFYATLTILVRLKNKRVWINRGKVQIKGFTWRIDIYWFAWSEMDMKNGERKF